MTVAYLRDQYGDAMVDQLDAAVRAAGKGMRDLKVFKPGLLRDGLQAWEYVDLVFLMVHGLYEVDAPKRLTRVFMALADVLIQLRKGEYTVRRLLLYVVFQIPLDSLFSLSLPLGPLVADGGSQAPPQPAAAPREDPGPVGPAGVLQVEAAARQDARPHAPPRGHHALRGSRLL